MSIASIGVLVTIIIFLTGIIFYTGKLSARVESLEDWRRSVRVDMHEISDKLETISNGLKGLATLIDERTDRRVSIRTYEEKK